jgi:hypothetical protein
MSRTTYRRQRREVRRVVQESHLYSTAQSYVEHSGRNECRRQIDNEHAANGNRFSETSSLLTPIWSWVHYYQ